MAPVSDGGQHRYQACRDTGCDRFACRVYREGLDAGWDAGYSAGYASGYSAGAATAGGTR
jgi:hypothetical protein